MDQQAIANALQRLYDRVGGAQAVYRGTVVVGHRHSVVAGSMYWAIPGRNWAHTTTLQNDDPAFRVITAPDSDWLINAAVRYQRLIKQQEKQKS